MVKNTDLRVNQTGIKCQILPVFGCETLVKLLYLSRPQFMHL